MTVEPGQPCPPERRLGRPRDARADDVILRAAAALLADAGAKGFTVDAVAAAAGVGKATIYRRWPSRARLMLDATNHLGLKPSDPDTGNLRDDMVGSLVNLAAKLEDTPSGRLLAVVIGEAAVNDEMREILREFMCDRREMARMLLERGICRGELPPDTDTEWLLDALGGPLFYRFLFRTGGSADDRPFIEWLVDSVLAGVRARAQPAGAADAKH